MLFNSLFIRGEIMSHKKRIKFFKIFYLESLTSLYEYVKQHKRTFTFFKSVWLSVRADNKIKEHSNTNHGQRKDNVEAPRRFLSLTNFLLTITNFERRFTNDYITYRERNSERVQCVALEIKTRPNERYRFSLC